MCCPDFYLTLAWLVICSVRARRKMDRFRADSALTMCLRVLLDAEVLYLFFCSKHGWLQDIVKVSKQNNTILKQYIPLRVAAENTRPYTVVCFSVQTKECPLFPPRMLMS